MTLEMKETLQKNHITIEKKEMAFKTRVKMKETTLH